MTTRSRKSGSVAVRIFLACAALALGSSFGRMALAEEAAESAKSRHDESRARHDVIGPASGKAEAVSEEAHEEGEHPLRDINWIDFGDKKQPPYGVYLINFGLLVWLLASAAKEPMKKALTQRRATVAKEIEEAQKMKKEAKARAKKYQAKLDKLDEELDATKRSLIETAEGEKKRIVSDAEEKAARMEKDAAFLLEQEVRQMKVDLVKETVEMAVAHAEEMLKQKVTQADHDRLAEDFLKQLAARPASKSAGAARGAS